MSHTNVSHANNTTTTNGNGNSMQQLQFPITPAKCLKHFGKYVTDYERTEILDFPQIFYFGEGANKIKGQVGKTQHNHHS